MRRLRARWCLALAAALLGAASLRAAEPAGKDRLAADRGRLANLDGFVTDALKEWHVPGLALAVVKDGEVLLTRGYGYRDLEARRPVTPRTLFAIASISKSFTVTGLGMLADEKKLDWDRPVREYLPDFRLHDRVGGDRVTARDLVTHRTGLPRHDAMWYVTKLSRREMYDRLRYLEPSQDLRYRYQYNNLAYMTAGVLLERASGKPWEEFVRGRLFAPLGMTHSNVSVTESEKSDDFARPYREQKGEVRRIPFRNIDAMAPAGSINSCAEDMARYLLFHLAKGSHGGKQLLSRSAAEEMQAPQMVIPLSVQKHDAFHEPGDSTYGLGLMVTRHRGLKLIQHGGSIDGFIALFSFLPEKNLGVVALSNLWARDGNPVPGVVTHEIYDRLLGAEGTDWRERGRQQCRKVVEQREKDKAKSEKARKAGTSPSHPLADFAGAYEHAAYGKMTVEVDGKGLKVVFAGGTVLARHYHYDTFEFVDSWEHPAGMLEDNKLTFQYGAKGVIDRVSVAMQEGVGDFVFLRAGKKAE
jgi:CubicO group peptidase (beta-lactamase class C family)